MTYTDTLTVILNAITSYGIAILVILGALLGISLAYLVFHFGWNRLISDKSLMIGGFYVRNTPYAGYNRFRSRKWNMEHTMK